MGPSMSRIVLCGGCFWCTEAVFQLVDGVTSVTPGYAGGDRPNPTYEEVCTGTTGHAECVDVRFDPQRVNLRRLLEVFFATHDPTTPNRQGNDVGPQYRSMVLYTEESQRKQVEEFIGSLQARLPAGKAVVTEVRPLEAFYPAEPYHHNYFLRNPDAPYCMYVVRPKVEKARSILGGTPETDEVVH